MKVENGLLCIPTSIDNQKLDTRSTVSKPVSKLMTNIIEKNVKDGQYIQGGFKLYIATKAYWDLCHATSATDAEDNNSNTKATIITLAVALYLQVMSNLQALHCHQGLLELCHTTNTADICDSNSSTKAIAIPSAVAL